MRLGHNSGYSTVFFGGKGLAWRELISQARGSDHSEKDQF